MVSSRLELHSKILSEQTNTKNKNNPWKETSHPDISGSSDYRDHSAATMSPGSLPGPQYSGENRPPSPSWKCLRFNP
jgi:hypothetical protein